LDEAAQIVGLPTDVLARVEAEPCLPHRAVLSLLDRLGVPRNAPQPPEGMPPHLAAGFGGLLARPAPLPAELGRRPAERIEVVNLPWAAQDRARARRGQRGVHDTPESKAAKRLVAAAVRELGITFGWGPVEIWVHVHPEKLTRDGDNVLKAVVDGIVQGKGLRVDTLKRLPVAGFRLGEKAEDQFVKVVMVKWAEEAKAAVFDFGRWAA
jgi:hypothetical protein